MTTHPSEEVVVTLPDVQTLQDAGIVLRPRRITEWPEPRVRPEPPRSLWGVEIGTRADTVKLIREIAAGFVVIVVWAVLLAYLVPIMFMAVQP